VKRVITFGAFDQFHIGHLRLLQRARALGDRLVVGVSTDELNFRQKGAYPACDYAERAAIVAALRCVAEVFPEESLEQKREYIQRHGAHVLVMDDDWAGKLDAFSDLAEVVYLPRTPDASSTPRRPANALKRDRPRDPRSRRLDICEAGLPGLVHFGASLSLEIPIRETVDEVSLFLPGKGKLTLEPVRLNPAAGHNLPPARVEALPNPASKPDPKPFVEGEGVRVAGGQRPTWRCRFSEPVRLDSVTVSNRRGELVSANYGLCAAWSGPQGAGSFDNLSAEVLEQRLRTLAEAVEALGAEGAEALGRPLGALRELAAAHLAAVAAALAGAEADLVALANSREAVCDAWVELLTALGASTARPEERRRQSAKLSLLAEQFIPKGAKAPPPRPRDTELAHAVLAARFAIKKRLGLNRFEEFATVLRAETFEAAEDGINGWAERFGVPAAKLPALITKHGMRSSVLLSQETAYRDAVRRAVGLMRDLGYEAALCYGALLGTVREGRFIAHDDDVDIVFHARACTETEVSGELQRIIADLGARGVRAIRARGLFLKLYDPQNDRPVDVFPAFEPAPGTLRLHMQRLRLRDIPSDLVLPFRPLPFYGEPIPAPARPEAFLEARYGRDWRIPDRLDGTIWQQRAEVSRAED
jgi:glycerol-3-phosphate cytidylyltransferase